MPERNHLETLACVASVSVWFRSKERGTRVKDRARFIFHAVKTENTVPRSFFAPKLNRNACYAGYGNLCLLTKNVLNMATFFSSRVAVLDSDLELSNKPAWIS